MSCSCRALGKKARLTDRQGQQVSSLGHRGSAGRFGSRAGPAWQWHECVGHCSAAGWGAQLGLGPRAGVGARESRAGHGGLQETRPGLGLELKKVQKKEKEGEEEKKICLFGKDFNPFVQNHFQSYLMKYTFGLSWNIIFEALFFKNRKESLLGDCIGF